MMRGKTMIRAIFVAVALLAASGAYAQNLQRVPTCGTGNPPAGVSPGTQDTTGRECVTGTITPLPATAVTPVVSTSASSSLVLKASPGSILSLSATSATPGYVMLFDATSAPADGAVTPKYCWQGPVSGPWPTPAAFAVGITAVYSTTGCATKTASATAWFSGQVQ
jgi:hypothetical protein